MRILVIEDNPRLAASIQQALVEQGHGVEVAHTGFDAEDRAAEDVFDLYVLDVMLPDRSGLDLCRNMRQMGIDKPILMLTALANLDHRVEGLDAGADDYLTKPFEYEELVARVRALLRRCQATEAAKLSFEDLEVDVARRTVERGGENLKFTAKEFALLEYFIRNKERVMPRSAIVQSVWETDYDPDSNIVEVYVSNLRKKLNAAGSESELIHTVIGTGYRFGAQVN
jgi:DNA-binding response OmpR family regulator